MNQFYNILDSNIKTFIDNKKIYLSFDSQNKVLLDKVCNEFYLLNSEICTKPLDLTEINLEVIKHRYKLARESKKSIVIFKNSNKKIIDKFTSSETLYNFLNFYEDDLIINLDEYKNLNDSELTNKINQLLVNHIKNSTNYDIAQKVLSISKDYWGNNLKLLILSGSSGKAKFIKNWSDFDIYFYLDKIPHKEMVAFTDLFKNLQLHIDTTFYSTKELQNLQLCERAILTLYETQEGSNIVLFKDDKLDLPYIDFNQLKNYNTEELLRAGNDLKRQMYVSQSNPTRNDTRFPEKCDKDTSNQIFNIGRIIKASNFLKKLLLRQYGIVATYANEVDLLFCEHFCNLFTDKNSNEFKSFVNNFALYPFKELIGRKTEPEIANYIINQGFALLELMDKINIKK